MACCLFDMSQCWIIVSWTCAINFSEIFKWNTHSVHQNVLNVICTILLRPNCVNSSPPSAAYMHRWTGSALVQIMACRLDCQLDPKEYISMKFYLKFKYLHSRKCIWTCHLWNGSHFVQGEMSYFNHKLFVPQCLLDNISLVQMTAYVTWHWGHHYHTDSYDTIYIYLHNIHKPNIPDDPWTPSQNRERCYITGMRIPIIWSHHMGIPIMKAPHGNSNYEGTTWEFQLWRHHSLMTITS